MLMSDFRPHISSGDNVSEMWPGIRQREPASVDPVIMGRSETKMASDREYVDLKLEAAEARSDARFLELSGKLDRVADSLAVIASQMSESRSEIREVRNDVRADNKSTRTTVLATALASVLALGALLVSMMTYGDAIFSRGMQVRDVVSATVKEQAEKPKSNDSSATAKPTPSR